MSAISSFDESDDSIIRNEVEDAVDSVRVSKTRKISYISLECYLCLTPDNPKKMISLAGNSKVRFREVAVFLKQIDEQQGANVDNINNSELRKDCCDKVEKEISPCYVCGETVNDPRMKRQIDDGFEVLAMEERLYFQGIKAGREVNESDRCCFCCQKRINGIVHEEACGNSMKMKIILQRIKQACIVCCGTKNHKDFSRTGRINMFIQTGMYVYFVRLRHTNYKKCKHCSRDRCVHWTGFENMFATSCWRKYHSVIV